MDKEAIMKRKVFVAGAIFLALGVIGLLGQGRTNPGSGRIGRWT